MGLGNCNRKQNKSRAVASASGSVHRLKDFEVSESNDFLLHVKYCWEATPLLKTRECFSGISSLCFIIPNLSTNFYKKFSGTFLSFFSLSLFFFPPFFFFKPEGSPEYVKSQAN